MDKMPHPGQIVVKDGDIPDTFESDCANDEFCFVHLDMDLYKPTLEAQIFLSKDGARRMPVTT